MSRKRNPPPLFLFFGSLPLVLQLSAAIWAEIHHSEAQDLFILALATLTYLKSLNGARLKPEAQKSMQGYSPNRSQAVVCSHNVKAKLKRYKMHSKN